MGRALEVFLIFLRLGLTSFGGPIAHLGYFRHEFVERRKWLDDAAYADLVALCQFLPGPASSQVGFAVGLMRAGPLGAAAAWLGFTAPSAALMIAAASGVFGLSNPHLIHGLKLVALAIVAHAVVGMARSLLTTPFRWSMAVLALALLIVTPAPMMAPFLIAGAGALGALRWVRRNDETTPPDAVAMVSGGRSWTLLVMVLIGALTLAVFAGQLDQPLLQMTAAMARTGLLVFGGGHAVLPLMEADVVGRGWLSADIFLAGYGFAQALPGPLFSFAAFVGAASGQGIAGAILVMTALFLPGLLLVAAALPLWRRLKRWPAAVGFVAGANAAVVGVLAAALYDPIYQSAVRGFGDLVLAAAGFAALQWLKAPSSAVVLGLGAAGWALSLAGFIG